MSNKIKSLLMLGILYVPAVSANIEDTVEFYTPETSFVFPAEEPVCAAKTSTKESSEFETVKDSKAADSQSFLERMKKVCANHAAESLFGYLQPKLEKLLLEKINNLMYGNGTYVLGPNGEKLPVLRDSATNLTDLALSLLNVNKTVRTGVGFVTSAFGSKQDIEAGLKELFGYNSLVEFSKEKSKELALLLVEKAFGIVSSASYSSGEMSSISDIKKCQDRTASEPNRENYLSKMAENGDYQYLVGQLWYELKIFLNTMISEVLAKHVDNIKQEAVEHAEKHIGSLVSGMLPLVAIQGPVGFVAAISTYLLYKKYARDVIAFVVEYSDQMVGAMTGIRDYAAFSISEDEVQQFHPIVATTTIDADGGVEREEKSYRSEIYSGSIENAVQETSDEVKSAFGAALSSTGKALGNILSGAINWFFAS